MPSSSTYVSTYVQVQVLCMVLLQRCLLRCRNRDTSSSSSFRPLQQKSAAEVRFTVVGQKEKRRIRQWGWHFPSKWWPQPERFSSGVQTKEKGGKRKVTLNKNKMRKSQRRCFMRRSLSELSFCDAKVFPSVIVSVHQRVTFDFHDVIEQIAI